MRSKIFSGVAKTFFIVVFPVLFSACEEERIRFSEPQPAGTKADARLRKPFPGVYFNPEDSVWLFISDGAVRLSNHRFWDGGKQEGDGFDGKISVRGDSGEKLRVEVKSRKSGDSLEMEAHFEEIILDMEKGGVAKYYKGFYFLNTPIEGENTYRLRILQLEKEGVSMFTIQSDSVLHILEKEGFVTKAKAEEGEEEIWTLNPSRKQLRELIRKGLFAGKISFRRVEDE
jgi:hypothetical protein